MEQKELKSLLKILRANGVTRYESESLSLSLGEVPQSQQDTPMAQEQGDKDWDDLTDEEKLFYSSNPPQTSPGDESN